MNEELGIYHIFPFRSDWNLFLSGGKTFVAAHFCSYFESTKQEMKARETLAYRNNFRVKEYLVSSYEYKHRHDKVRRFFIRKRAEEYQIDRCQIRNDERLLKVLSKQGWRIERKN
ncbi:hypothetical protein TNCT_91841 [Trichonephila clavata]|uniref:Uncharacterized protein n=1 Tax=Trichonephila clavata TaxID=2740835 RepID=A0A8X6LBI7_TRICU|nr:hypothetical protein TNCT_91841 [Trichonephila clavata]